jgi:ATP-binding cassette subfamily B protein
VFRRYPLVRQHDETDCGAAALATILLYHGRPAGLEKVRDYTGTDRQGSSLLGLVQAAQRLGFSAQPVKGPYDALATVPLPAIAHTRTEQGLGHFVVLYRVRKRGVLVADPVGKLETLSREDFCKRWTGYLLLLAPEAGKEPVAAGGVSSPWRRLLGLLAWQLPILAEAFLCALLMAVLGITTSFFIQQLVDNVLIRQDVRLLNALGLGMILVLLFRILFGTLRQYLLASIGRKVDLTLVSAYHRHLLELPLRFFEMRRVGEILSRIGDADKVRQAISGTTLTIVVDGTLVSCLATVLWLYDLPLALVATAFVPLLVFSLLAHHGPARRLSRQAMEQHAALAAHLVEDVSGVETIKSFGMIQGRLSGGETRLVRFVQSLFSMQKLGLSLDAIGTAVTALAGIAILWYGGHRVMQGFITTGQLLFFSSLLAYLLDPLARLAGVNLAIQEALVAVDRLYQVLDLEPEVRGEGEKVVPGPIQQGLELKDVSFRYGSRGKVLEGINLRIGAGETVAIVGESGSGKSTLLKLLLGFYAPTEGSVVVDGVDLRDIDLAAYRQRVGWVSQDPFIFTGTIRENIAMGHARASLTEVSAAAQAAGLGDLINSLPDRYETVIGERGANLSGGQRQRLAIARALLREPDLLIFDEATSHLDTATERAIQKSLRTVLVGKTVLLVAHRLSTVKDADRILVLQQGRIVEEGTHRQLMARPALYAALWQAQTEEDEESREWNSVLGNGWHEPVNGGAGKGEA